MDTMTYRPTPTQSKYLSDWQFADDYFRALMNILIHEDSVPFTQKEAIVANYAQACPMAYPLAQNLNRTLDRLNPAYAGMTEYRTCGERFYRKQGEWKDVEIGAMLRLDSFLHVKTQITHLLSYTYQVGMKTGTIVLDGVIVFSGKVHRFNELPDKGINLLLCKVDALPF